MLWDGAELTLPPSRKVRALLGYLAATGTPQSRDRLCALFWDRPDDPRAALRWALSKLRQVVPQTAQTGLQADRQSVFLKLGPDQVDLCRLKAQLEHPTQTLSLAELTGAAEILQSDFLAGTERAGSPTYRVWLEAERAVCAELRARVLGALIRHPDLSDLQRQTYRRLLDAGRKTAAGATPAKPRPTAAPPRIPRHKRRAQEQKIGLCRTVDGVSIAHATIGSGPPLVKAANWLSHLEYDWTSPIWGRSFDMLSRYRTFVRYDERGCGMSDWDVPDLSLAAFVSDLEAVVDQLGLTRFPLLGISQGSAVSIEYAVRHPDKVSALILFGGYAAGWRHLADAEEQARREAVIKLTEVGWGTDTPAYRHIFSQTFMPEAGPRDLAWFDEFQRLTTSPENAARFQEAFGQIDVRHRLAQVQVPTLVLHARFDQRIPVAQGQALADGIPGARFLALESRNHILLDNEPAWPVASAAVSHFLREVEVEGDGQGRGARA